jgi:hypothetical protein
LTTKRLLIIATTAWASGEDASRFGGGIETEASMDTEYGGEVPPPLLLQLGTNKRRRYPARMKSALRRNVFSLKPFSVRVSWLIRSSPQDDESDHAGSRACLFAPGKACRLLATY